jgi:hypothetical protein
LASFFLGVFCGLGLFPGVSALRFNSFLKFGMPLGALKGQLAIATYFEGSHTHLVVFSEVRKHRVEFQYGM